MADKPLAGKVAIVTGAASPIGMGRAMALALAGAGAKVALLDVDAASLEEAKGLAEEMAGKGNASAHITDISDPNACQTAVERTIAELGGLHILVNNAGIQLRRPKKNPDDPVRFSA